MAYEDGYDVWPAFIKHELCSMAMRRFYLELRKCGVTAEQVAEWSHTTWWPQLRDSHEVLAIREYLPLPYEHEWAEPQIVFRLPDENVQCELTSHTDTEPDWAIERGLVYGPIYGVMLTPSRPQAGTIAIWEPDGINITHLDLSQGDVLRMNPSLPHAGTLNLSDSPRAAIYYRTLTRAE